MSEFRIPQSCPCCDGELVVTRLRCTACGTELVGDFGAHRCGHDSAAPADEAAKRGDGPERIRTAIPLGTTTTENDGSIPAGSSDAPTAPASVRDQILARVAAGELDASVAADLLARLD